MNFAKWFGLILLLAAFYILWQIRQLLLLVFTAVILATALNRLVNQLQVWKIKRNLGIAIVLFLTLLITVIFFVLIIPPFIVQFEELIALFPQVWDTIRLFIKSLQLEELDWLPTLPSLSELLTQLQPLGTELFKNFFSFFSNSFAVILQVLFILVLSIMMLVNPQEYRRGLLKLFPSFYRRRADQILTYSEAALANWFVGIVINCIFIGLLSGIGLWVLQVKLVLAHALLAGLLNFIPNIGPALSVVFPIMVALTDSPWKIIAIIILYFIIQNIESYWLTPIVMAKQVSLLPAITLSAQIFFATAFGVLGLLLALPLTVVTKTWFEEVLCKDILDKWHQDGNNSNFYSEIVDPWE